MEIEKTGSESHSSKRNAPTQVYSPGKKKQAMGEKGRKSKLSSSASSSSSSESSEDDFGDVEDLVDIEDDDTFDTNDVIAVNSSTNVKSYFDQISQVNFFSQLSKSNQEQLFQELKLQRFEDGEDVVRQGEKGDRMYVIIEGEAVVWREE
mmetsp:Transcript_9079/g.16765  ORF Transcript_9079/g.16765 Transcript_9079/m.16765 type:complete len:150 (-) Transcript_9079:1656-2105(-)